MSNPAFQPVPVPVALTDEELEATARAAEIQYMKKHGGLTASTPDGLHAQLQAQRLAGLRAVLARYARPTIQPVAPTKSDVTELFYRHMGEGSEVGFENAVAEALARWGTPAIKPVPVARPEDEYHEDISRSLVVLPVCRAPLLRQPT